MADGNIIIHSRVIAGLEASGISLEDADGAGHVVTRCPGCRHRESTDTSWWRMSHIASRPALGGSPVTPSN
jgi:hypothetical protein